MAGGPSAASLLHLPTHWVSVQDEPKKQMNFPMVIYLTKLESSENIIEEKEMMNIHFTNNNSHNNYGNTLGWARL